MSKRLNNISQYESPNIVIVPISTDSKKSKLYDNVLPNKVQVTAQKKVTSADGVKEKQSSSKRSPYATPLLEPNSLKSQFATSLLESNSLNVQMYDQCRVTECERIRIDAYPSPFDLPIQQNLVPYINSESQFLGPIQQNNVMETCQNIAECPYLVPVKQNMVIYQNSFHPPLIDPFPQNIDVYQSSHDEPPMLVPIQQNMYQISSESPFIVPTHQNLATCDNALVCPYVMPARQNLDMFRNSSEYPLLMPIQQNIEAYRSSVNAPFVASNQQNMDVPMSIQQNMETYPSNVEAPCIVPNQQNMDVTMSIPHNMEAYQSSVEGPFTVPSELNMDVPKQSETPIQNSRVQMLEKSLLSEEKFNNELMETSPDNKNCQLAKDQNETTKQGTSSWASNYLQSIGQTYKKPISLNLLSRKPRKTVKRASSMKKSKIVGVETNTPTPTKAPETKISSNLTDSSTEKISGHELLDNNTPSTVCNSIYQTSSTSFNCEDSKVSLKDTANSNIKINADEELFHKTRNIRIGLPHSQIGLNSKEPKLLPKITEKPQTEDKTSDHGCNNKTVEKLINSNSIYYTNSLARDLRKDTKKLPRMNGNGQIREKTEEKKLEPGFLKNKTLKTYNNFTHQPHCSTTRVSESSSNSRANENANLSQATYDSQYNKLKTKSNSPAKHKKFKYSSQHIHEYKDNIKHGKFQHRHKREISKYLTPDRKLKSKRDPSTSSRDSYDEDKNVRKKRKITHSEPLKQRSKNFHFFDYEHENKSSKNHKKQSHVTAQQKREKGYVSMQSSDDFDDENESIIKDRRKFKHSSDLKSKNTQRKTDKITFPSQSSDSSEDSDDFLKNYQKIQSNFSSFSSDLNTKKLELLKELLDRELKKRSYNSKEFSKLKIAKLVSSVNKTISKNKNGTENDKNKAKNKNKIKNNQIETPSSSSSKNGQIQEAILKPNTIIKSIVEVTQKFKFGSPPKERKTEKFDLRTKLSHKSLSEYFNKVNKKHTKKMPEKHENLIVTVQNDAEDDEEILDIKDMGSQTEAVKSPRIIKIPSPKIKKSETKEVKSPNKKKVLSPNRKKLKKINLILTVVREKSLSSSNTDDECEGIKEDCISLSSEDSISRFLDAFNVDEIAESSQQVENDYNLNEKSVEEPSKTNSVKNSNNSKYALSEKYENKFNLRSEVTRNVTRSSQNDNTSFVDERLFSQITDMVKEPNITVSGEESILTGTKKVENCKNRDILAKQTTFCQADIKVEAADEQQEENTDIVVLNRNETEMSAGNITQKNNNVNGKEISDTETSRIRVTVETKELSVEVNQLIKSLGVGISNTLKEAVSQTDDKTEMVKEFETFRETDIETSANKDILNDTIKKTIREPNDIKLEYCREQSIETVLLEPLDIKEEPNNEVNVEAMASSTYGDISNMLDDTVVQNICEIVTDGNIKHEDRTIGDGIEKLVDNMPDNINIKTKLDLHSENQINVSSNSDVSDQNTTQSVNIMKEYINKQSKISNIEQQESDIVNSRDKSATVSIEHKGRSDVSDEDITMPLIEFDKKFLGDIEARMYGYLQERYTLKSVLSKGRFSRIYKCEDSRHEKYALKIIKNVCDRFSLGIEKETMLTRLQKDIPKDNYNCVFLLNSFGHSGLWCFLMEYYPKNLDQALLEETKPFHISQVQWLARQLVAAVIILRNNGVVHSDIAPRHILLNSSNDRLKLCGFDKSYYHSSVETLPNIGTASYRAPEIIMGYSAGYSIDVWSTALVIYEMATKRQRFPGICNNDILYKQMCVLGHMPTDMIEESLFGSNHFAGTTFMRRIGPKRQNVIHIKEFYKTAQLHTTIYKVYNVHWKPIRGTQEMNKDYAKLSLFYKLLNKMLVLHPKKRLPIEFVYAHSFIHRT